MAEATDRDELVAIVRRYLAAFSDCRAWECYALRRRMQELIDDAGQDRDQADSR